MRQPSWGKALLWSLLFFLAIVATVLASSGWGSQFIYIDF